MALGLGILALSVAGVIDALDDWLFDRLVVAVPSLEMASEGVLVIATDRELTAQEIVALAESLNRHGGRLAVFLGHSAEVIDAAARAELSGVNALAMVEREGLGVAPPPRGGIWRGIHPAASADAVSPLISTVADALGLSPPASAFYLDFKVRRDGFQRVDAKRVLGGDLPRSLVEGKVVLVGRDGPSEAMLSTPVHQRLEALSPVMFQAAVIDAFLRGGIIGIARSPIQWSVALAVTILFVFVLWRRKFAGALWVTVAGVVTVVVAAWLALWLIRWWLPPMTGVTLLCAAGVAISSSAAANQRIALRRAVRNLAVDAQDRAEKGGFLTAASPWALVEDALAQLFGFESSFVLRADVRSGAIAAATEGGEAATGEYFASASLRQDQEPFSTALQERGATLGDDVVVLPIGNKTRLFGFWVFRSPEKAALGQARVYADRLAAMFELREAWRERARPHQLGAESAGALRIHPLHDQLEGSIDLLDSGRKVLAEALDRSTEAVLVYDPFGKLTHISRRSVELLGSAGIEYSETRPVDLLASLTGIEHSESRRALRFVALNREEATFKASAELVPGRELFIHIRSLTGIALTGGAGAGGGGGLGLPGLLLLIQDVTQTARAALLKDEFIERIYYQLNNDFEAILVASSLLDDPRVEPDERAELLTMISEKIEQAAGRVKETRSHLQTEFSPVAVERYPVRFEPVFNAARAALRADLESHQVTIEAAISDYLQLVLAAPEALEELLRVMLLTLLHDAREESRIAVEAVQGEAGLTVSLSNEGFGMPQAKLERYLEEGAGGHETLEKIGAGLVTVSAWGGSLTVRSEVGVGMTFELKLVSVI